MADRSLANEFTEAVDQELRRSTYPEGFPHLPEIPSGRYYDPAFYELEMQHLWPKSWLYAAHISEVREPGSYKLFERLGMSIIISNGTDGVIRAFRNSCRHRGAALVTEQSGKAKRFACPYHSWVYGTDGALVSVPHAYNYKCLDMATRGLLEITCDTWNGFVFINVDGNADSLDTFMEPVSEQKRGFPLEDMVVKDEFTIELDCNWKTAYDNFLEAYHINTVHSKSLAPFLNTDSFQLTLLERGHGRFLLKPRTKGTFFDQQTINAIRTDFTTPYGTLAIGLPVFPNAFAPLNSVGFTWKTFWPISPNKTALTATLMGWKRDDAEDKAFWVQMRERMISLVGEDIRLFSTIQRSMEQGDLPGILIGFNERQIYWYNEHIDRCIGREKIPAHLQIEPVLQESAAN